MEPERQCPNCGRPVRPDAPGGLCPACLIKAGLESCQDQPVSTSRVAFEPPSIGQLNGLFPQLEILELVGTGGMGAVYKARQPDLDRLVAIKILPPQVSEEPGFAERFTREARALARLTHPNIVAVHDYGQSGGYHYLIMEYVDGVNLRQLQRSGRLSAREALAIVPQICDALQYAHDEGIVHRDIKPENILIDRKGRVKIADFGLAKILGQVQDLTLTAEGHIMGTPHYMAPEQVEHPTEVDHRADIYSLGVVFYEMLTGELPLGKFQPPSKKVQVDVRLDEVVLRALEKEPQRRYQHASQVKTDVETIASTRPAPAVQDGSAAAEPSAQLEAWRKGLLWYGFGASAIGLPVGLALQLPLVWGLSLAGLAICTFRLSLLKGQSEDAESAGQGPKSAGQRPAGTTRSWLGFPLVEEQDGKPVVLWASVAVAWIVSWGILSLAIPLLWMTVGKELNRFTSLPACLGIGALLSVLSVAVGIWRAKRAVAAGLVFERDPPRRQRTVTAQQFLGGSLFIILPTLAMWFVLFGHRLLSVDLDADVQFYSGGFGLPMSAAVGALLAWLSQIVLPQRNQTTPETATAAAKRWSRLAIGAIASLVISLPLGGGAAVMVQLILQETSWNPSGREAAILMALLGGAGLTAVCATLLGIEALRRIRRSAGLLKGRTAAIAAAWFWPCFLAGQVLLAGVGSLFAEHEVLVTGRVTDAFTGKPIAGGRVDDNRYGAGPARSPQQAWTDANGYYELSTWYEEHTIAASAPGYQPSLKTLFTRPFGRATRVQMDFALQPLDPFGPETVVTLNDIDDARGSDLLDLDAGRTLDLEPDFQKWPREQRSQWLTDKGVDLMLDHVGQWGLMTPQGNPTKLVLVDNAAWEDLGRDQFERELGRVNPVVQTLNVPEATVYLVDTNAAPPLTFAFATANGARGLLQVTEWAENPNCMRIRFKHASFSAPGSAKRDGLRFPAKGDQVHRTR